MSANRPYTRDLYSWSVVAGPSIDGGPAFAAGVSDDLRQACEFVFNHLRVMPDRAVGVGEVRKIELCPTTNDHEIASSEAAARRDETGTVSWSTYPADL